MKILVDTNVALDILLERGDFYPAAMSVFLLAEKNVITGYVSASAVTDIFYVAGKHIGKAGAREAVRHLLHVFHPATVTDGHIYRALDFEWDDFEDCVQHIVGESVSADYIVTRDVAGFAAGSVTAITPERFLETISVTGE